jgi:hypothetical protein
MSKENLIAACGLYCGACEMYRAYHDNNESKLQYLVQGFNSKGGKFTAEDLKCDGCLAAGRLVAWGHQCKMRLCDRHGPEEPWCSSKCPDFPCKSLTDFANMGITHHNEIIDNLRRLEKAGIKKHTEQEEKRWLCPECQTPLAWYDQTCHQCGAKRPEHLYKVPDSIF